jgi:hypothetical protein
VIRSAVVGRVARASLVVLGFVGVACRAYTAVDVDASGPDGGAPDGATANDGNDGSDANDAGPDGRGEGGSRRCATTTPFDTATALKAGLPDDVRSARVRNGVVYYSFGGIGTGTDLGAAQLGPTGGVGASFTWFASVNDSSGQSLAAPSADGLVVVYQDQAFTTFRRAGRTTASASFGVPSDLTIVGAINGTPTEPYITAKDALYFSTSLNTIYAATLGATAVVDRPVSEIGDGSFPVVSDDELEIFFMRSDAVQSVYHASRLDRNSPFRPPSKDPISSATSANTRPVWLSPDACTMFVVRTSGTANDPPLTLFVAKRN